MPLTRFRKSLAATAAVLGIGLVAGLDFATGVEVRVLPMYYLPLSLAAWQLGRSGALLAAGLCAVAWLSSNHLSGLTFSHRSIWFVNTAMQGVSFATVGLLVAALKDRATREQKLSRTDPLTSLPNSRAFHEQASRLLALSRRMRQPVTMAYIDLDDFKAVNDTLGHEGGDDLLRRVAEVVRTCIRTNDASARLGGDEFALCLFATGRDEALATLQRLRSRLAEVFSATSCPVTATIGAVTFVSPPQSVGEMVSEADSRMYAAKAAGKDRVLLDVMGARPGVSVGLPARGE